MLTHLAPLHTVGSHRTVGARTYGSATLFPKRFPRRSTKGSRAPNRGTKDEDHPFEQEQEQGLALRGQHVGVTGTRWFCLHICPGLTALYGQRRRYS